MASHGAKTVVGRWFRAAFGRMFCKRSIIIISDHKTQHLPFSVSFQFVTLVLVLGFVTWGSYSTGSYMAAQQVLKEKDKKIAFTQLENERVGAEFALLKRDLTKLAKEGEKGKLGDYAQMVAEQYSDEVNPADEIKNEASNVDYNAVFQRIEFLEERMKEMQQTHEQMLADIRSTTGGKIKDIENIIAMVGMDKQKLVNQAEAQRKREEARKEKYGRIENGRGGPYQPPKISMLKEKDTELYFDLKRLMVLNDIIESMPLAKPITTTYRLTSGFGTRVDPFRGHLAFHSGMDLAAPYGTKVIATTDGRIGFTGWRGAYGQMIDVEHGFGFSSRYGHLSKILVQKGQFVKKGQVIGIQGSTGRSTGQHVHYEVRYNNKPLNPKNFLKAGENVRSVN
ncbi:MAG: peptidoglycan DD-metalloendopeptidase family protein [Alphaproteobacteria bacterium]|nr:peptidoglycan DD-metalloendopeptidase family protein [Alphaproteobacteria bacterium]